MKKSEIRLKANEWIKDIFCWVLKSEDKEVWKDAINYINKEVQKEEATCGKNKFIYREVRSIMVNKYALKFNIKK